MKGLCALCRKHSEVLHEHHFIPRGRHQETKLIKLCFVCHSDVHSLCNDKFLKKYFRKRSEFIKVKEVL